MSSAASPMIILKSMGSKLNSNDGKGQLKKLTFFVGFANIKPSLILL